MSTTAPRFARPTAARLRAELAAPLPSTLAELARSASGPTQHGQVAARLAELRGRRVELARQLAEQEAADERAAAEAAAAGRSPGRRQKAASIRKRLEEIEAELAGFEDGLAKSADSLLAAAVPHRRAGRREGDRGAAAAIARAQELLAAADAALAEAGSLAAERAWLARLDGGERIEPFRPVSGDPSLGQLRAALRDAFADWRDAARPPPGRVRERRAYEAEQGRERLRHEGAGAPGQRASGVTAWARRAGGRPRPAASTSRSSREPRLDPFEKVARRGSRAARGSGPTLSAAMEPALATMTSPTSVRPLPPVGATCRSTPTSTQPARARRRQIVDGLRPAGHEEDAVQ